MRKQKLDTVLENKRLQNMDESKYQKVDNFLSEVNLVHKYFERYNFLWFLRVFYVYTHNLAFLSNV